ncbi:MAG: DUF4168 domain-containing protein [Myxococcota bacterium]
MLVKVSIRSLLVASLSVAYGCTDRTPEPQTPDPSPTEYHHDGEDVPPPPPPGPGEPPPPAGEPAPPPPPPTTAPPATPPGDPQGAEVSGVSPTEVEQYAEVQIALLPLHERFVQEKQSGASQAQLERVQSALRQEAEQIVDASPLSLQRFEEIAQLVQRDPNLQERVKVAIERRLGGS